MNTGIPTAMAEAAQEAHVQNAQLSEDTLRSSMCELQDILRVEPNRASVMPMWRPDLCANRGQSCLDTVLVEVDPTRQVSVSSKEYKAADSENGGNNKSQLISFWCKMRNVGVLSSSDENFIEELKRWATANGYRVEQL